MESLHNGAEYPYKLGPPPPIMPKPSRYRPDNLSALTPVRTSSSTTSSETPVSPPWSLGANSETIDGHCKPMPSPHSTSIPQQNEEEVSLQSSSPHTHLYPSPPYTLDSTHFLSPQPARAAHSSQMSLSLRELVEKYSHSLPLQIKVLRGYSGQTSQLSLSSGDYYNIHFVKHQEVVSMNDKLGFAYTVPLNSSFRFGLVYSEAHHQDTQVYGKVADLLTLSPLPKVACATRDVKGSDERNTIVADEILVVKRIIRPKLRKKSLEVLSLKTQSTKILPLDCEGYFTLNPRRNQIYLLELVRCIPDTFPCEAVMFLSADTSSNQQRISPSFLNATVTLMAQKTETSLIASSVTYASTSTEESRIDVEPRVSEHLGDIPVDDRLGEVEVAVVDTSEYSLQEVLNHKTRTLFETFDVTRVKSWYDTPSDNTQSLLYASIGRGSEGVGIQVDKPLAAYLKESPPVNSVESAGMNTSEEALYESVYSPSMDDIDSGPVEPPHNQGFPTSSNATQYEQPHLSMQNVHATSCVAKVTKPRKEATYDPLPLIPQVAPAASTSVQKTLRRSRSQYALPISDLFPNCYEHMHPRAISPFSSSISPRYSSWQNTDSKLDQLMATTTSLKSLLGELTHRVSRVEVQVREMSKMSAVMKRLLEDITAIHLRGHSRVMDTTYSTVTAAARSEAQMEVEEQNRRYLDTLTAAQVMTVTSILLRCILFSENKINMQPYMRVILVITFHRWKSCYTS